MAHSLSVIDAAILIAGGDPSETYWHDGERIQSTWQHDGYDAAFSALRQAVLSNKLKAEVRHAMRSSTTHYNPDGIPYEAYPTADDEQVTYDMLVARHDTHGKGDKKIPGQTRLNFSVDSLRHEKFLYIAKEPNWKETTLDVELLREWLERRGVYPDFFFPEGSKDSVSNMKNPRYSAKLSCALAAWEAVKNAAPNKSVKQTLQDWVQSNGVRFGVGENGVVSPTAAEEIAKIANWNTKGGANPTSSENVSPENGYDEEVENYQYGYPMNTDRDDDLEIPF